VTVGREPDLAGQTVAVIGGSSGIGLETARRARTEGADVILVGRDRDRLDRAAQELGAERTAAFDATDEGALAAFFRGLPGPIDHVMVTGGGPTYSPILEMDSAQVRQALTDHATLMVSVARNAVGKVRPGGTLLFMGAAGERVAPGIGAFAPAAAALPPLTATLALEIAPIRSTSSRPASSTLRCRPRCSAPTSTSAAPSCGRRCRSAVSSARPTSPRWRSTS
jgi:NAD(P)-dependent dehydrogenase (short-subunit alcohol dehydrogenase family)